jgi:hypothetical protein
VTHLNAESDGLLAAPRPGRRPFHTPDAVEAERERIHLTVNAATAGRLLMEMSRRAAALEGRAWQLVAARLFEMSGLGLEHRREN